MENTSYEKQHKEEYFRKISLALDTLLESIRNISVQDNDYEILSGRTTGEVSGYIRECLIKPLIEAKTRLGIEEKPPVRMVKRVITGSIMQRLFSFYSPLGEIFDSLKEVPLFEPAQYEKLIQNNNDIVEVLTDFIDKLEEARKRRLSK